MDGNQGSAPAPRGRRRQAHQDELAWIKRMRTSMWSVVGVLVRTVEVMDLYTAYHQQRVTKLACALAWEMGLPTEQCQAIHVAGLLHDIGNIYVPDEILNKLGLLDESEFHIIQDHASVGHYILSDIEFPWPVAQIVLQHHERMNGSGYPAGLSGEDILPEARVLAVADVVGAMTSIRRQRPPLSLSQALEEITRNRGVLYDSTAVDACLTLFGDRRFSFE
jgi:putative nucleotidyltransferase with HDIG domain